MKRETGKERGTFVEQALAVARRVRERSRIQLGRYKRAVVAVFRRLLDRFVCAYPGTFVSQGALNPAEAKSGDRGDPPDYAVARARMRAEALRTLQHQHRRDSRRR